MAKRWCGFSVREHGNAGAKTVRTAGVIGLLLLAGAAAAEEPADFLSLPAVDLEREGDPAAPIRVGDQVRFRVEGDFKAADPGGAEPLTEQGWSLVEQPVPGAASPAPGSAVTVVPIKPGALTLPSLPLKDASGKAVARTNPLPLQVVSAISKDDPKPQEPVPLKPPVSLKFPWLAVTLLVLVALAVAGLLLHALVRWSRRKHVVTSPVPASPPKPEDEVALAALAALEAAGFAARGQFKKHYFGISETLKVYLGLRYGFDAPECTSSELIAVLEDRKILSDRRLDQTETLFELLDRVKFTDHVPAADEPQRLLEEARRLVLETRRISGGNDAPR
ncbi:MAG: hypothetical protein NDJ90_08795 [Oligoflexia bacterium]|nr:hypothetical protein [Oligoflexia bacterium]